MRGWADPYRGSGPPVSVDEQREDARDRIRPRNSVPVFELSDIISITYFDLLATKPIMEVQMRVPELAIGCVALALTTACQGHTATPGHGSKPSASRPAPSPTPSTHAQLAHAIRTALTRQGSGMARLEEFSGGGSGSSTYHIDCAATKGRAEIVWTSPGRAGLPPVVKSQIITDGQAFYSKMLNVRSKPGEKPWYHGGFRELESNEFRKSSGEPFPTLDLYLANCDQPSLLAWFTKDLGDLAKPGPHTCSFNVDEAIRRANGYAREFYRRLKGMGGEKAGLTVWLDKGLKPTKYKIAVGRDYKVQDAHWDVTFEKWHMAPVKLPPKNEIR